MRKTDIIICGFDYEITEKIIDIYARGIISFSSVYVNGGAHREDRLLCHMRIGEKILSPYIAIGDADILHAGTWEDAVRYYEWVKEGGTIKIEYPDCSKNISVCSCAECGDDSETLCVERTRYNEKMKEFILRHEKSGAVRVVHS